jgi:hypothetical protein
MNDAVRTDRVMRAMRAMRASSSDPASLASESVPVPEPGLVTCWWRSAVPPSRPTS